MKVREILVERVKARIDHPEDLIWRDGSNGYLVALNSIDFAQRNPKKIKIKFDGTPSLIVGRDNTGTLILTDKAGFGATKYDGHAKSSNDVYRMLYNRSPTQEGREQFAKAIATLYPLFDSSIDKNVRGYYQGDLLYVGTPDIIDEYYVFKPNKIEYKVKADSELGRRISISNAGIVFHGFFKDRVVSVPDPIDNVSMLKNDQRLFVLNSQMGEIDIALEKPERIENIKEIDKILNYNDLKLYKISDFPLSIGRYMGYMARTGKNDYNSAPQGYIDWLPYSKLTVSKQNRIKNHISQNMNSYMILWKAIKNIAEFKTKVKRNIDEYQPETIDAYLDGEKSHEGYVVHSPSATIKLVDRHKFMREKE